MKRLTPYSEMLAQFKAELAGIHITGLGIRPGAARAAIARFLKNEDPALKRCYYGSIIAALDSNMIESLLRKRAHALRAEAARIKGLDTAGQKTLARVALELLAEVISRITNKWQRSEASLIPAGS